MPDKWPWREMKSLKQYILLLRPHQWIKNGFVFLPLFFGSKLMDIRILVQTAMAFVAFCATASAVYVFNDYLDREDDCKHPLNRLRPLASGAVPPRNALIMMSALAIAGTGTYYILNLLPLLVLYIALNVLYTLRLKHVPILDVVLVSFGFVIRIFIGSQVSQVSLSVWIVIMTFLLALFLALAKRRNDVLIYLETGEKTRKSVDGYNTEFLNASMVIMASVVIVAYILYTISPDVQAKMRTDKLYLTSFFVVLGILRYMQITIVENDSGGPTRILLQDRFLQLVLLGWLVLFSWILYFK
jgi:4-hydroxybenzoate polyprenyltransferase